MSIQFHLGFGKLLGSSQTKKLLARQATDGSAVETNTVNGSRRQESENLSSVEPEWQGQWKLLKNL